jgi:hypothetical protein
MVLGPAFRQRRPISGSAQSSVTGDHSLSSLLMNSPALSLAKSEP